MLKRTPLYDSHLSAGAKMVNFGGWEMPVNYGSQIQEHHAVRNDAGMFDVSHMRTVKVFGPDSKKFLRRLVANDVNKLLNGKALYSCMLNAMGGVIDDLIIYKIDEDNWRVVVNASTADSDVAWMRQVTKAFDQLTLEDHPEYAMVAVQGPNARDKVRSLFPTLAEDLESLKVFSGKTFMLEGKEWFFSRTGYTGEDGFEIAMPSQSASYLWAELAQSGVAMCGLGARDTLRMEAGMNLYGHDMTDQTSPLTAGLAWTVDLTDSSRMFIGRAMLEALKLEGGYPKLVGLKMLGPQAARQHYVVRTSFGEGEVTSGGFAPTLGFPIALARVPHQVAVGDTVDVEIRGKKVPALVVKYPFARHGKALVE